MSAKNLRRVVRFELGAMLAVGLCWGLTPLRPRRGGSRVVLIPDTGRKALIDRKAARLIVIACGPLSLLPFETLVARSDKGVSQV